MRRSWRDRPTSAARIAWARAHPEPATDRRSAASSAPARRCRPRCPTDRARSKTGAKSGARVDAPYAADRKPATVTPICTAARNVLGSRASEATFAPREPSFSSWSSWLGRSETRAISVAANTPPISTKHRTKSEVEQGLLVHQRPPPTGSTRWATGLRGFMRASLARLWLTRSRCGNRDWGRATSRPRRRTSPCARRSPRPGRDRCGRRRSTATAGARSRDR